MLAEAKVALVHDWLTGMRGGERCLESLCELFPGADIFTLLHMKGSVSKAIEERRIRTSAIQTLPLAATRYRYYLPLFPSAIERFNLDGYDLVISSSHCVAKGVKPPSRALHIAYVHTPMRYIWDMRDAYAAPGRMGPVSRLLLRTVTGRLRRWDVAVNSRVDHFVANSLHVAHRIRRHYNREATVIYPPVDTGRFRIAARADDYYLVAGAFAPYKRIDLAIEAFNRLRRGLVIVGDGQEGRHLRRIAGPTIEFVGWRSDREVAELLSRCRALVFPGEEDFGILPVEAMASGRPVIAYGRGGATETVVPLNSSTFNVQRTAYNRSTFNVQRSELQDSVGPEPGTLNVEPRTPTGVFFHEQTVEELIRAVEFFERSSDRFDPEALRAHALIFDRSIFEKRMIAFVSECYETWKRRTP